MAATAKDAGNFTDIEGIIGRAIGPAGRTLESLVEQRFMYPKDYSDVFVEDAERKCLREHLAALQEQGRIENRDGVFCRTAA